jgi:hypothetical protein
LSAEQAAAIAKALAEADYITKADLGDLTKLRFDVRSDLARLKNELVRWIIGTVGMGVLVNHFWK